MTFQKGYYIKIKMEPKSLGRQAGDKEQPHGHRGLGRRSQSGASVRF